MTVVSYKEQLSFCDLLRPSHAHSFDTIVNYIYNCWYIKKTNNEQQTIFTR
jgi:hypothetical protein